MHSQDDAVLRLAWGITPLTTKGPKPQFSLPEIAQAGLTVADEVGLDGLSLARVAAQLGLTTTALYRYVPSKEILIELITDTAAGEAPALDGQHWQDKAVQWTHARATQIRLHPWLTDVHPTGLPRLPNTAAWIEALLAALAPHPEIDGLRLALLLDTVALTYTRNALSSAGGADWPENVQAALRERNPHLSQVMQTHATMDELSWAIRVILNGLATPSPRQSTS